MKRKKTIMVILLAVCSITIWKCNQPRRQEITQDGGSDVVSDASNRPQVSREPEFYDKVRSFYNDADADISFYGRVIDETGKGVDGATVHFQLERSGLLMADGKVANNNEKGAITSSADGTFSIRGRKGLVFTLLKIEKVGYRHVGRNVSSFGYRGTPDMHRAEKNEPVDFLIVDEGTPETKVLYDRSPIFSWNQGPVEIKVPSLGAITLLPTRQKEESEIRGFDWHLTVSIEGAEMVPIRVADAPIAPFSGYGKKFEYGGSRNDKQWTGAVRERYAFKTQNGLFGIIDLFVVSRRTDGTQQGSLEIRINESGARNLDG